MNSIKNLVKTAGKITSWYEGAEEFLVTRNAAGKPTSVKAFQGKWESQRVEFIYGALGEFLYLTGDMTSLLLENLVVEATRAYVGDNINKGRRAIVLGHSYADKHWTVSAAESTFNASGAFNHANAELHQPWDIVANGGVTGDTSAQILARVDALLATYRPDWVLVAGVTLNDILANATADTIIANMEDILAKLSGLNIVWCTDPATTYTLTFAATAAQTSTRKAVLHACNRWLKEQAASAPGLIVVDTYSATVDTATGYGLTTMFAEPVASDKLHYNTLGAASAGRAIVRAVNRAGGLQPSPVYATGVDDYKNLVFNPYAVGDNASGAGGYTQGAGITLNFGPNGWISESAFSGTAELSKEASATATEVQGNFAKMHITAGANRSGAGWQWWLTASSARANNTAYALGARITYGNYNYRCVAITTGTSAVSGWVDTNFPTTIGGTVVDGGVTWACFDKPVVGDRMVAAVEFEMDTWTAGAMPYLYVTCNGANFRSCVLFRVDEALPTTPISSGVLMIPEFEVPVGTTTIEMHCRALGNVATDAGNFKVRRVGAWITEYGTAR